MGVHGVLPPYRYTQHEIRDALAEMGGRGTEGRGVLDRVHAASGVRSRHLALPLERYRTLGGFGEANAAYVSAATELAEEAVRGALRRADIPPSAVELVVSTSVTGLAVPSIEARLAGRWGLPAHVKRVPVFGLGCVAGAAGLARVHDYLEGHPEGVAVLLCVELCSLTVQRGDASAANVVAGSLFGDGAAALVAVGRAHPAARARRSERGPETVATRSRLYPDTEHLLGWDVTDSGFRIVLGSDLPDTVLRRLGPEVRRFLADHDLKPADVTGWICHPGGPKVLEAVRAGLDLPARALESARRSLAEVGNLSSASVLHVLRDTLDRCPPLAGTPGLMLAMGPGFSSELVLLRW
ncbi:putative Type III polyketide synthase [Actinacidiphila reveromycinica]|uniref:Putative Type III polyketide synthase n=1 Tax=Actinacidiphila reveromycinica TaxID=659352 RepID=A0A7U3UMW7_9ACTN|nr:putative Type III polyketide synthase [Streptomyces sp. SN-593]